MGGRQCNNRDFDRVLGEHGSYYRCGGAAEDLPQGRKPRPPDEKLQKHHQRQPENRGGFLRGHKENQVRATLAADNAPQALARLKSRRTDLSRPMGWKPTPHGEPRVSRPLGPMALE